jgi:hypothetical protein
MATKFRPRGRWPRVERNCKLEKHNSRETDDLLPSGPYMVSTAVLGVTLLQVTSFSNFFHITVFISFKLT